MAIFKGKSHCFEEDRCFPGKKEGMLSLQLRYLLRNSPLAFSRPRVKLLHICANLWVCSLLAKTVKIYLRKKLIFQLFFTQLELFHRINSEIKCHTKLEKSGTHFFIFCPPKILPYIDLNYRLDCIYVLFFQLDLPPRWCQSTPICILHCDTVQSKRIIKNKYIPSCSAEERQLSMDSACTANSNVCVLQGKISLLQVRSLTPPCDVITALASVLGLN